MGGSSISVSQMENDTCISIVTAGEGIAAGRKPHLVIMHASISVEVYYCSIIKKITSVTAYSFYSYK